MKTILENYNLLIAMTVLTSLAILMKCVCAISYQMLSRETEQMNNTKNAWLKGMVTKFESCYQLKMPMQNPGSFVKLHLERYRLAGISLRTLEGFDLFTGCITTGCALLTIMGGIYYKLPTDWIVIQSITLVLFLFFLGTSELLFQTRRKRRILIMKMENYFANTLHPKLMNQYIYPEELQEYRDEYFLPDDDEGEPEAFPAASTEEALADGPSLHSVTPDMQELIDSLLEESKISEELEKKKQELTTVAAKEKMHLVEEIMKEYIQV
ncbi:MAG: hypothetical protein HFH62_08105 [Lachnospiraceae bacterium]|nr:hypothetical protein [Lachnospiraceae bacterium]